MDKVDWRGDVSFLTNKKKQCKIIKVFSYLERGRQFPHNQKEAVRKKSSPVQVGRYLSTWRDWPKGGEQNDNKHMTPSLLTGNHRWCNRGLWGRRVLVAVGTESRCGDDMPDPR